MIGTFVPTCQRVLALLIVPCLSSLALSAQEPPPTGKMWLFEDPPLEHLEAVYGLELDEEWLERARLSGLRFAGGTGSFVSSQGLVLTNHHVVRGDLSGMDHEGKDLGVHGYIARTREQELRIPGRSVSQLVRVEDVTEAVFRGVDLLDTHEEVERALARNRQTVLAQARRKHEGYVTELVSLYRRSRVHLYVYKVYSDLRLVFAPELGAGYFGGETDNFRFPRFALDFALCRVYEDERPVDSSDFHFGWSDGEFGEGETVFSVGNPGSTRRLLTMAELEYQREALFPAQTANMGHIIDALDAHASTSPELEDQLREMIFGLSNGHKSRAGILEGLRDETLFGARRAAEDDLRERLAENDELSERYGDAWEEIELAAEELAGAYRRWWYQTPWYHQGRWFRPLQRAMALVEEFHPDFLNEDRIATAPTGLVYPFEPELYAKHLEYGLEALGADDPAMQVLLRGMSPAEAVRSLLEETQIRSIQFENELRAGGWEAIEASEDPAIVAACELYPLFVQNIEEKALLEAVIRHQAIRVGKAIDAIEGPIVCPEASFSLRLSAGTVAGYSVDGQAIPANTRFEGLFARTAQFGDQGDFDLPDRWFEKKDAIDLATPLNFVCTVDSTGGSSGSPIFDKGQRIVGVLFDGNEQGVEDDFVFLGGAGRAVIVHSEAMLETLTAVYDAPALAAELRGEAQSH